MSWADVYPLFYPRDDGTFENVPLALSDIATMNQPGDYNSMCLQIPDTGDVVAIGIQLGTVTTGGTWKLTLESLDGSGRPGGKLDANAEGNFTVGDNDDNTWQEVALNGAVSVTRGQHVCVKVEHLGTDSGEMTLASFIYLGDDSAFPYIAYSTTGGSTSATLSEWPVVAFRYYETDGAFQSPPSVFPATATSDQSYLYGDTDKDDEFALKFRLPFNAKVKGFWTSTAPNADLTVRLLSINDSELSSVSFSEGELFKATNGFQIMALFPSDVTLSRDTWYRLGYKYSGDQGSAQSPGMYTFQSIDIIEAMDGGRDFFLSSRKLDGNWTDYPTRRPQLSLVISEIEVN